MALSLQPSPQTLSPWPPTAHRSPQRAEPTLMGLTPMHTLVASGAAPARSVRGFEHQMVDEPDTAFTTTGHVAAEPAGALASVPGGRPPKQQRRSRGCWGDFAEVFWDGMRGSRVSQSRSNAARMASVRSAD